MKKIAILTMLLMLCFAAKAFTIVSASNVSGNWTIAGSPYIVKNNITVSSGQALTIDPGVEVIFAGPYQFTVNGRIYALGTATSRINFHVADTTGWYSAATLTGGWKGFDLFPFNHADDSSVFRYCRISDTKWTAIQIYKLNLTLSDCEFFHNGRCIAGSLDSAATYQLTMDHCSLHNNRWGLMFVAFGKIDIRNCTIYDNTDAGSTLIVSNSKVSLSGNTIRYNTNSTTTIDIKYSEVSVKHNSIHHNVATEQASLSLTSCNNADINGNFIVNNRSTKLGDGGSSCALIQGGAGLRIMGEVDSTENYHYLIRNNVIANNSAAYAGGAIYIYDASATIVNNHMINNTSGRGGGIDIFNNPFVFGHSMVKIKNNIFHNNFATLGGNANVYMAGTDSAQYEYNCTQNEFAADVIIGGFGNNVLIADTSTNVIFSAAAGPGLINEPTASTANALNFDFRLLPTSIAIDKGDTTGAYADTSDFDCQQRIYGPKIDMGACEYSLAGMAHTGIGVVEAATPGILLYPNPASGRCNVQLPSSTGLLEVVDQLGRSIIKQKVSKHTESIDVSQLAEGVYFVVWRDASGLRLSQNLVVAR